MYEIEIGKIIFPEIRLEKRQIPAFRGAVASQFREFDLLHNHAINGSAIYRYAAVQFKTQERLPLIYAIGAKAIDIFKPIFLGIDSINLNGIARSLLQKELIIKKKEIGIAEEDFVYKFTSPWIALNQENYKMYLSSGDEKKKSMLEGIAINNIIGFAKYAGYTVSERIRVGLKVKAVSVSLKGEKLWGFNGFLKTNFMLPDLLGLGKSVSRGYGVVMRVF